MHPRAAFEEFAVRPRAAAPAAAPAADAAPAAATPNPQLPGSHSSEPSATAEVNGVTATDSAPEAPKAEPRTKAKAK